MTDKPIRYWYGYCDGRPMRACSECSKPLNEPGGIRILLVVADTEIEVRSQLVDGYLLDTDGDAVAKGFHSETQCYHCSESLSDFEYNREEDIPRPSIEEVRILVREAVEAFHEALKWVNASTDSDTKSNRRFDLGVLVVEIDDLVDELEPME